MHYTLSNLKDLSEEEIRTAFSNIPNDCTSLRIEEKSVELLTKIYALIPKQVTVLDLSWSDLSQLTGSELARVFAAIPQHINELDLIENRLGNKTVEELVQAFTAIPKNVVSLNLRGNQLYMLSGDGFAKAFKAIPENITQLNLSNNEFNKLKSDELVEVLGGIPKQVTSLDLGWNQLGVFEEAEQKKIFAAIPKGTCLIDLEYNGFSENSGEKLATVLRTIPEGCRSINLVGNAFFQRKDADLSQFFNAITINKNISIAFDDYKFTSIETYKNLLAINFNSHLDIISGKIGRTRRTKNSKNVVTAAEKLYNALNLAGSNFLYANEPLEIKVLTFQQTCLKAIEDSKIVLLNQNYGWRRVLANITESVSALGKASEPGLNPKTSSYLSLTWPSNKTDFELIEDIEKIPEGVSSLDLSGNHLGNRSSEGLARAFEGIPRSLRLLNLSRNKLVDQGANLAHVFKAIPEEVTSLDLSSNNLENHPELATAFAAIPAGISSLNISDNFNTKHTEEFIKNINAIPNTVVSIAIDKNKFLSLKSFKALNNHHFYNHLSIINQKADKYRRSERADYKKVVETADKLQDALIAAADNFLIPNDSTTHQEKLATFKEVCLKAITDHRTVLEQHRGWDRVLNNIAKVISAISSIITFGIYNCIFNKGLFDMMPVQTDYAKRLDDLVETIKFSM